MSDPFEYNDSLDDLPEAGGTTWSPAEGQGQVSESSARQRFKAKVVPAMAAYSCCRKGYLRSSQYFFQLLEFIQEKAVNTPLTAGTVLLPRVEPFVRATYNPAPVGYGKVVLTDFFGTTDPFDIPQPGPELMRLEQFIQRATEITKRTNQDCYRCVERALLGQSKKRQRVTLKKPAIGGDDHLRLRVPHK